MTVNRSTSDKGQDLSSLMGAAEDAYAPEFTQRENRIVSLTAQIEQLRQILENKAGQDLKDCHDHTNVMVRVDEVIASKRAGLEQKIEVLDGLVEELADAYRRWQGGGKDAESCSNGSAVFTDTQGRFPAALAGADKRLDRAQTLVEFMASTIKP